MRLACEKFTRHGCPYVLSRHDGETAESSIVIVLLAAYVEKAKSLEKVSVSYPMSVRDLLTFNLFLQLTDGLVSYQAFALGAVEANPVVAAAILNWGMWWGLIYNKVLACLLLLLIFVLRRNRRLLAMRGLTVTASVYVCAIIVCLWQLLR